MTKKTVLDLYFLDARHKLIEIGAFLDRVDRASGDADFRLDAFLAALGDLARNDPNLAKTLLQRFSDPTSDPISAAATQGACGAYQPRTSPLPAEGR